MMRKRIERVRTSLVGSDVVTPGADFSSTLFLAEDNNAVCFAMDWIGTKPRRPEAASSPLPLVSEAGGYAAWRAYSEVYR